MKEEEIIRKMSGKRDPFRVPENYFEQFAANLMDKLPEREAQPAVVPAARRTSTWRMWAYAAAAAVCGIAFLGTFYLHTARTPHAATMAQTSDDMASEEIYIDDMLDYTMVDNYEIASYLTGLY